VAVKHVAYEVDGWGVGELWLDGDRVVWHDLPVFSLATASLSSLGKSDRRARRGLGLVEPRPRMSDAAVNGSDPAGRLIKRLRAYFAGDVETFDDVELDLEYETPFLERCAHALRAIPRGEVVTYGELAALAGAPGAARAAGSFCARNRLGLFVPCHRVVSAGGLGSYGSHGVAYKKRLLELEGVAL
jgi:methylated-DNA-[protein]-cysteine S-methyltransferase